MKQKLNDVDPSRCCWLILVVHAVICLGISLAGIMYSSFIFFGLGSIVDFAVYFSQFKIKWKPVRKCLLLLFCLFHFVRLATMCLYYSIFFNFARFLFTVGLLTQVVAAGCCLLLSSLCFFD